MTEKINKFRKYSKLNKTLEYLFLNNYFNSILNEIYKKDIYIGYLFFDFLENYEDIKNIENKINTNINTKTTKETLKIFVELENILKLKELINNIQNIIKYKKELKQFYGEEIFTNVKDYNKRRYG